MSDSTPKREWYIKTFENSYFGVNPKYIRADTEFYHQCTKHILDDISEHMSPEVVTYIRNVGQSDAGYNVAVATYECKHKSGYNVKQELIIRYINAVSGITYTSEREVAIPGYISLKTALGEFDGNHWFTSIETKFCTPNIIKQSEVDDIVHRFRIALEKEHNPKLDEFVKSLRANKKTM